MNFSILIVTYNNFSITKECLKTILGTNYNDLNIIIIDNGFTDLSEISNFVMFLFYYIVL